MKLAKKLDKAFKQFISADCRKEMKPYGYQAMFARVSQIALDEYDQMPWIPSDNEQPDHLTTVVVWLEPTESNTLERTARWATGWYNWKHDIWVVESGVIHPLWKVTHWTYIKAPV
jgi:hypothetical protein